MNMQGAATNYHLETFCLFETNCLLQSFVLDYMPWYILGHPQTIIEHWYHTIIILLSICVSISGIIFQVYSKTITDEPEKQWSILSPIFAKKLYCIQVICQHKEFIKVKVIKKYIRVYKLWTNTDKNVLQMCA